MFFPLQSEILNIQLTSYDPATASSNVCEPQGNPVYSTIADSQIATPAPSKLSLEKTPYYQELESDQLATDYETPIKSKFTPPSTGQHEECENCRYGQADGHSKWFQG